MQNSHNILKIILIIIITACVTASSILLLFCQKPEISQSDNRPVVEESAPVEIQIKPIEEGDGEIIMQEPSSEPAEESVEPQLPEIMTMYSSPAN